MMDQNNLEVSDNEASDDINQHSKRIYRSWLNYQLRSDRGRKM